MPSSAPQKMNVVGTAVSLTSYAEVVALCRDWAEGGNWEPSRYVCVTSVHGLIEARMDGELRRALDGAEVVTPDGMPIVWALRSFGVRQQQRVYGPTLMLQVCEMAARHGIPIFLYGALPETLKELRVRLCGRYPGLRVAGWSAPPFRPLNAAEEADVQQQIRASGARIVFVGLSTPKQEKWMRAQRGAIAGVTMIGVGAAFDFHAGRVRQAPEWMQGAGLEWLFRLAVEPFRLWRRYLLVTPRFLPLWAWQWVMDWISERTGG